MLDSLHRRRRGRALAQLLDRTSGGRVAPAPRNGAVPAAARPWDPLSRQLHPAAEVDPGPVTRMLFDRLDEADLDEMRSHLRPDEARALEAAGSERERMQLSLALALHHVPDVARKTGLSAADPPEEVHSMARGPLTTGGAYYYADLVAEAVEAAGASDLLQSSKARALDFGSSSGRVVRVLQAAYPWVSWHGCDPQAGAIEWASENLSGIEFAVSPEEPPLPYRERHFNLVISIGTWAGFSEPAAISWYQEIRRILRKGGLLVSTQQGLHVLYWLASGERWRPDDIDEAVRDLYARGFHWRDIYGDRGDWDISHPDWGFAVISPEWLLDRLCPEWAVVEFQPGRVEGSSDLVVLERRR